MLEGERSGGIEEPLVDPLQEDEAVHVVDDTG